MSSCISVILEYLDPSSLSCFVRRHSFFPSFSIFKSAVLDIQLFLLASFLALTNFALTCFSAVLFSDVGRDSAMSLAVFSSLYSLSRSLIKYGLYSFLAPFGISNGLLKRHQETGVGCHIGHCYSGAFAYAADLTLLSPSRSGLSVLISECEKYATEHDMLFNGNKIKLKYFKGRFCKPVKVRITVSRQYGNISKIAENLGHTISAENKHRSVKYSTNNFCMDFNLCMSNFRSLGSIIQISVNFVVTFMEHHYGILEVGLSPHYVLLGINL